MRHQLFWFFGIYGRNYWNDNVEFIISFQGQVIFSCSSRLSEVEGWWSTSPFGFLGGVSGGFPASSYGPYTHSLYIFTLQHIGSTPVGGIMNLSLGGGCVQPFHQWDSSARWFCSSWAGSWELVVLPAPCPQKLTPPLLSRVIILVIILNTSP